MLIAPPFVTRLCYSCTRAGPHLRNTLSGLPSGRCYNTHLGRVGVHVSIMAPRARALPSPASTVALAQPQDSGAGTIAGTPGCVPSCHLEGCVPCGAPCTATASTLAARRTRDRMSVILRDYSAHYIRQRPSHAVREGGGVGGGHGRRRVAGCNTSGFAVRAIAPRAAWAVVPTTR